MYLFNEPWVNELLGVVDVRKLHHAFPSYLRYQFFLNSATFVAHFVTLPKDPAQHMTRNEDSPALLLYVYLFLLVGGITFTLNTVNSIIPQVYHFRCCSQCEEYDILLIKVNDYTNLTRRSFRNAGKWCLCPRHLKEAYYMQMTDICLGFTGFEWT